MEIEQQDANSIEVQRENQRLRMEIDEVREKMVRFDELMKEQVRLAIEQERLKHQVRFDKIRNLE